MTEHARGPSRPGPTTHPGRFKLDFPGLIKLDLPLSSISESVFYFRPSAGNGLACQRPRLQSHRSLSLSHGRRRRRCRAAAGRRRLAGGTPAAVPSAQAAVMVTVPPPGGAPCGVGSTPAVGRA
jgi:hypothetical protein